MTSQEIAADLGVTLNTISFHRKAVRRELGARNEAEVMKYGVELELFMPEGGDDVEEGSPE